MALPVIQFATQLRGLVHGNFLAIGDDGLVKEVAPPSAGNVASVFGRTGAVTAQSGDYGVAQIIGAAPLASPAFTGVPTAPTPASNDSSTKIATTAFVQGLIINGVNLTGPIISTGNVTAITAQTGTGTTFAMSAAPTLTTPTFTAPVLGTPASGNLVNCTFPTLNQNTTGTAANVTGTVAIANGGTGHVTAAAALAALLPTQTGHPNEYLVTTGFNAIWAPLEISVSRWGSGGGQGLDGSNADGSIMFSDALGMLSLEYPGNFIYAPNTAYGPLATGTTLYLGDRVNLNSSG